MSLTFRFLRLIMRPVRIIKQPVRPAMAVVYALVLATPWTVWWVDGWSRDRAFEALSLQARHRVGLYADSLRAGVGKVGNIPLVLAEDPQVAALLGTGTGSGPLPSAAEALSRRLEDLNRRLDTSAIYVLDASGMTVSASNWNEGGGSFVGQSFAFRPYFMQAREGQTGHYFALGTTSNQPGYYIARPVRKAGNILGVVVVKLPPTALEADWSGNSERVFVTDSRGIIFLTNHSSWRFRSRQALPGDEVQAVRASRQYGDASLSPLDIHETGKLTVVDGRDYLSASEPLPDEPGWVVTVLLDAREAKAQARLLGLLTVAGLALVGGAVFMMAQRTLNRRRQTRELERRVRQRTVELEAKQEELVQAAKLAALGQMSAGMAHEINQPLAALRTYAENAVTYLTLNRPDGARENLGEIVALTERMARITGQLKQFARKSRGEEIPLSLADQVEAALSLLSGRLRQRSVQVMWAPPPPDLRVWADDVRLQQVLVNLFRNALDAMEEQVGQKLELTVLTDDPHFVRLLVSDNGPGIAEDDLERLFEPFFSTKPTGEGLGLGLSISESIMRDLGGTLTVANRPQRGACFTIALRRVRMEPEIGA